MHHRLAVLALIAVAAAGCGNSQPSHLGEYGTQEASTPDSGAGAAMAAMTLDPSDLGGAWQVDPAHTYEIPIQQKVAHEPPALRDIDLRGYWDGYQSRSTSGRTSLVSTVALYRAASAPIGFGVYDMVSFSKKRATFIHLKPAGGTPGDSFAMWRTGSGAKVAFAAIWTHDNVIATAMMSGPGATASRLMTFAQRQDRKVGAELFAAMVGAPSE
jgi:hypothetical protein